MTEADASRVARFDELFRANVTHIETYCRWRARSAADAEDALGEVFLTAWRRLVDMPLAASEARVWLYATARRVTANQYRAARRRSGLIERIVQFRSQAVAANSASSGGPQGERVHEALGALRAIDREVLLLAEWEELTAGEIAQVMGCSAVSARGRLHRARKRFRAAYEQTDPRAATTHDMTPKLAMAALAEPADSLGRTDHA